MRNINGKGRKTSRVIEMRCMRPTQPINCSNNVVKSIGGRNATTNRCTWASSISCCFWITSRPAFATLSANATNQVQCELRVKIYVDVTSVQSYLAEQRLRCPSPASALGACRWVRPSAPRTADPSPSSPPTGCRTTPADLPLDSVSVTKYVTETSTNYISLQDWAQYLIHLVGISQWIYSIEQCSLELRNIHTGRFFWTIISSYYFNLKPSRRRCFSPPFPCGRPVLNKMVNNMRFEGRY